MIRPSGGRRGAEDGRRGIPCGMARSLQLDFDWILCPRVPPVAAKPQSEIRPIMMQSRSMLAQLICATCFTLLSMAWLLILVA